MFVITVNRERGGIMRLIKKYAVMFVILTLASYVSVQCAAAMSDAQEASAQACAGVLNQALFDAVKAGDREQVASLLERRADVHARDHNQETPLHYHAVDNVDIVRLLLQYKADPSACSNKGRVPIHRCGSIEGIQTLLAARACIDAIDYDGNTILHFPKQSSQVLGFLLGKDAPMRTYVNYACTLGKTPLHRYAESMLDDDSCLNILLVAQADIYAKDKEGNTPLHLAAVAGTIRVLRERGAFIEAKNIYGATPLACASERALYGKDINRLMVIKALLKQKADVNAIGHGGYSVLQAVVSDISGQGIFGSKASICRAVITTLIDAGAQPFDVSSMRLGDEVKAFVEQEFKKRGDEQRANKKAHAEEVPSATIESGSGVLVSAQRQGGQRMGRRDKDEGWCCAQ